MTLILTLLYFTVGVALQTFVMVSEHYEDWHEWDRDEKISSAIFGAMHVLAWPVFLLVGFLIGWLEYFRYQDRS
jgi:hypothetical protein